MPAVSSTMSNGVGARGFGESWKNVLADAGTAAKSASIPRIDNLFAMLNWFRPTSQPHAPRHSSPERIYESAVKLSESYWLARKRSEERRVGKEGRSRWSP